MLLDPFKNRSLNSNNSITHKRVRNYKNSDALDTFFFFFIMAKLVDTINFLHKLLSTLNNCTICYQKKKKCVSNCELKKKKNLFKIVLLY